VSDLLSLEQHVVLTDNLLLEDDDTIEKYLNLGFSLNNPVATSNYSFNNQTTLKLEIKFHVPPTRNNFEIQNYRYQDRLLN
jgi:hypothetical protein